jgi:hypothetical protein
MQALITHMHATRFCSKAIKQRLCNCTARWKAGVRVLCFSFIMTPCTHPRVGLRVPTQNGP